MTQAIVRFDANQAKIRMSQAVTDAKIAELAEQYMALTIDGIDDKEGYEAVHQARMVVKGLRVKAKKLCDELKADALNYQRTANGELKRITAKLTPIEERLKAETSRIDAEKERIKKEEEAKRLAELQEKLDLLTTLGKMMHPDIVAAMDDDQFDALVAQANKEKDEREEAEAKRKAEEEAARKKAEEEAEAERQRIAAERAAEEARLAEEWKKIEAERKSQAELQAKIEAEAKTKRDAEEARQAEERRKLEAEKLEIEKARAAEAARQQERERIERERLEAEQQAEREAEEKKRREALKPDRDKLMQFASYIREQEVPELSKACEGQRQRIVQMVFDLADDIEEIAEGLK